MMSCTIMMKIAQEVIHIPAGHTEFRKLGPKIHAFQNKRKSVKTIFCLPFPFVRALGNESHRLDHTALLYFYLT